MEQKTLKQVEAEYIRNIMSQTKGDIKKASKLSGICRATMYRKLNLYKIDVSWYR